MKRFLTATAIVALSANMAMAEDNDPEEISLSGAQTNTCVINLPSGTADSSIEFDLDGAGEEDAIVNATEESFTYGDSYCNFAHSISITAAQMSRIAEAGNPFNGANSDTFNDTIDYTVTVSNWDESAGTLEADTSSRDSGNDVAFANINTAYRNDAVPGGTGNTNDGLEVVVTTIAQTDPLLAGSYSGTVTIEIKPQ